MKINTSVELDFFLNMSSVQVKAFFKAVITQIVHYLFTFQQLDDLQYIKLK